MIDTPRQYLDFNQTDFWFSSSFGMANEFCLWRGVDRQSLVYSWHHVAHQKPSIPSRLTMMIDREDRIKSEYPVAEQEMHAADSDIALSLATNTNK